jgi:hypothetical protein
MRGKKAQISSGNFYFGNDEYRFSGEMTAQPTLPRPGVDWRGGVEQPPLILI